MQVISWKETTKCVLYFMVRACNQFGHSYKQNIKIAPQLSIYILKICFQMKAIMGINSDGDLYNANKVNQKIKKHKVNKLTILS